MRSAFRIVIFLTVTCSFGVLGWSQSSPATTSADPQKTAHEDKQKTGPGKEMGKGGEDIGKGAAKGTGELAKGTAGAVGNLAQGNVGSAGVSLGKGAAGMAKNVAVGTGKGVGKIGKGIGGEFKKLGAKSKPHDE
jgi:hypothetical protein